jgi:hypothetical protein
MKVVMNQIKRRTVSIGTLLGLILLLVPGSRPSLATDQTEDIYRLFQVDLPSADVAMLLDASRSMKDHQYANVRQAVVDFAPTLTDKETLQLRVFGDTVSSPLEGKGDEVASSVAGYLPTEPFFGHTDLGLAILKAIEFLEREGSSRVQALFVVTDGLHGPPNDSPYSRDFNDPSWRALQQRAQALCARHKVFVYGFGLGQQTDIAVLRRVFPAQNVEVIVGGAAHVTYALRQVRERLSRTQLRQAVEQELSEGRVEARLDQSAVSGDVATFGVPLTIRSTYRHLPIVVEQIKVLRTTSSSPEISCEVENAPARLPLAPGKEWRGRAAGELKSDQPRWHLGKTQENYSSSFEFIPLVRFQDEAALVELGLLEATPTRPSTPVLRVDLRASYGISYWTILLIGSTALGCAAGLSRVRQHLTHQLARIQQRQQDRRRISGKLKTWKANEDEPEGDGADLENFAAPDLQIVKTEDGNFDLASTADRSNEQVVARVSAELIGASPRDGESGKLEFVIKPADLHWLRYEAGSDWREVSELTLCDNDVLAIDGQWMLRYVNNKLRTRAEVEGAQGDDFHV